MFELENFSYMRQIYPFEWVMLGIYCILIFGLAFSRQVLKLKENPLYRFFFWAVAVKIMSSVVFCLIYIYYYQGGDTVSYYETSRSLVNLSMKSLSSCIDVMTSPPSLQGFMTFDSETGYPWPYMYYDSQTFFVAKLIVPLEMMAFKSYLVTSVLLSYVSFFGAWKFFLMLCRYFPGIENRIAIAILFVPSVLFWGSGILKDTITFSAVCWFIVSLEAAFIAPKKSRLALIGVFLTLYILLAIKPYILYSLLPGAIIWIGTVKMKKIRSKFIRIAFMPIVLVISVAGGFAALSLLGSSMGKFAINKMLETASVTQKDLKQDYYQGSSFDIGDFDPTVPGMMAKVPAAMAVGLFRPYVWEARNVVMIASGLENLCYLLVVAFLLLKILLNPKKFFKLLSDYPILTFLLCYTLFFSVMVGLSTSNFGALVRFKIPFMSCYIALLLILHHFMNTDTSVRRPKIRASRNILSENPQGSAELANS
jgi:hypothetical protein